MRVGSLVCIARPWEGQLWLRDTLGIVIEVSNREDPTQSTCMLRIISRDEPSKHDRYGTYMHRVDVIKE